MRVSTGAGIHGVGPHRNEHAVRHGRLYQLSERGFEAMLNAYARGLDVVMRWRFTTLLVFFATVGLSVYLFMAIPKGFFPQQDTGRMMGMIQADQSISFQSMRGKLQRFVDILRRDPAVETVVGYTGSNSRTNSGFIFATLKPPPARTITIDEVIGRLRGQLAQVPGATLFLQGIQDFRAGGRMANAQFQYTLSADELSELRTWEPRVRAALRVGLDAAVGQLDFFAGLAEHGQRKLDRAGARHSRPLLECRPSSRFRLDRGGGGAGRQEAAAHPVFWRSRPRQQNAAA